ncbi:MAG: hypothetical protein NVS3B14_14040 [Ktedonobacteraceae bacterium]
MIEIKAKLTEDGKIEIPAEQLKALGLHVGDEIILRMEDGALRILTPRQAIEYAQELLRPYMPEGRSLSEELIAERRQEN